MFHHRARGVTIRYGAEIHVAQPFQQRGEVGGRKVEDDPGIGLFGDAGGIAEGGFQQVGDRSCVAKGASTNHISGVTQKAL